MKVIIDTSTWIAHFKKYSRNVERALKGGLVILHPWIIGELALGDIPHRLRTLRDLKLLPQVRVLPVDETFEFIERFELSGSGLGWVDINILLSALSEGMGLITEDKKLRKTWEHLR